ncbi:MAG: hypothetical protein Q4E12_01685 [Coriobacteriia bacterium]|nr:hypothetical protein [Coriobacteriia bacterium]
MYYLLEILDRGRFGMTSIRQWEFWRNVAVYFCLYSLIGHWIEIPYCLFNDVMFGIVDPETGVYDDPLNPFMIYGFGVVICAVFMVPLKDFFQRKFPGNWRPFVLFFLVAVVLAMAMELGMGLVMNQPNAAGVYPLWDNSQLPGNILGQAWIVNDLLLGMLVTLFTWMAYPASERFFMSRCTPRGANIRAIVVIVLFVALCIYEYGYMGVGNIYNIY